MWNVILYFSQKAKVVKCCVRPSVAPERLLRNAHVSSSGASVNKHFRLSHAGSEGKLTIIAQKMSVLSGRGSSPGSGSVL